MILRIIFASVSLRTQDKHNGGGWGVGCRPGVERGWGSWGGGGLIRAVLRYHLICKYRLAISVVSRLSACRATTTTNTSKLLTWSALCIDGHLCSSHHLCRQWEVGQEDQAWSLEQGKSQAGATQGTQKEILQVDPKREEDVLSRTSLSDYLESGYCSRRLSKSSSLTGDDFSYRSRSESGDSVKSTSSTESTESMSLKKEYYVKIREEDLDDLGAESWIVIDMKVIEVWRQMRTFLAFEIQTVTYRLLVSFKSFLYFCDFDRSHLILRFLYFYT